MAVGASTFSPSGLPSSITVEVFNPEAPFGGVQVFDVVDRPLQIEINTGSPVSSVFGRVGDIIAKCSDYASCYAIAGSGIPVGGTTGQILAKTGLSDYQVGWSSAGAGSVTEFSAGTLSPLFVTSVLNPTTTPALSFTLSNAGAHTFLGNNTGGSAPPSYVQPAFSDLSGTLDLGGSQASGTLAAGRFPALSGDVSTTAGSLSTSIGNNVVTYAKMQQASAASILIGRGAGSGAGNLQEITLGTNLSMTGTVLNATGGGTVPVGQITYVDKINGNDSTGLRGRLDKPFLTIQPALNVAQAGDIVQVGPGTFDIGTQGTNTGRIVIPANVNLYGSGRGVTIIKSDLIGTLSPFTGFIVPGNNSIISDLSGIAYDPGGTITHCNPISKRAGAAESWTNVRVQRCHLYGLADTVFAGGGASLGDMTFVDCLIEAPNDIFMWQSASNAILERCELRHTTLAAFPNAGGYGMFDGGSGGTIKSFYCRYKLAGATPTGAPITPVEAGSHIEVYDYVIDLSGFTPSSGYDLTSWAPGNLFISNVRKVDNTPFRISGSPIEFGKPAWTVATLPSSPQTGLTGTVTDGAASLGYGVTVTGGGSTKYFVWYDGTAWKVVGGGTITGGGNVSNSGTPTAKQTAVWVDATHIEGVTSIAGGSTGQVLKKNSATDFDYSWSAAGTGTVTTTGTPASGNLTQFSGATSITNVHNALGATAFFKVASDDSFALETADTHLGSLGAVTVGKSFFTLTNPNAITFPRINANNTVSALDAPTFRTAIGATSIGSNFFTLASLAAITFARINADNTITLQNANDFKISLGATSVGINIFGLTNPNAVRFIRINADNSVTARTAGELAGDLSLVIGTNVQAWDTQLDSLAALSYTGNALKVIRVNAGESGFELATASGGGNVSNSGTPTAGQTAVWTDATHIQGVTTLAGGTTGQVLKKSTNTDYDYAWGAAGSGAPGGNNTEFQYNNGGAFGGISAFTYDGTIPGTITLTPGANTVVTGLFERNTAAATVGNPQHSPSLRFQGHSWDTNSGTDVTRDWRIYQNSVSGYNAYPDLFFDYSSNGGTSWTPLLSINSYQGGALTIHGTSSPLLAFGWGTGTGFRSDGAPIAMVSNNSVAKIGTAALSVGSTTPFAWTDTQYNGTATIDTALYRNAAGIVEVNNGTAGQYRDLTLRKVGFAYGTGFTSGGSYDIRALDSSGVATMSFDTTALVFRQQASGMFGWSGTAFPYDPSDTALARNAAGVVEANNGTSGTYRDILTRGLRSNAVTFANAIASPVDGTLQAFTDSTTNTQGATITGGGSNHVVGYYNGTNWIVTSGAGGGGGNVTTSATLTSNALILGNGGVDTKISTGLNSDGAAQLVLGVQNVNAGSIKLISGSATGDLKLGSNTTTAATQFIFPNASTDLSATGGTGHVLKQATSGGAITSGTLAASDVGLGNVTNDAQIKSSDFPASSVDSEIALFNSTSGKSIKRATGSGLVKATSGVYSTVTAPTGDVVGTSDTQTLTNKRVNPRTNATTSNTNWTPNSDSYDEEIQTALAGDATINAPSGTPVQGQKLILRITSNTSSHNLSFNGTYTAIGVTIPTTIAASKTIYVGCIYNSTLTRWDVVAVATQA